MLQHYNGQFCIKMILLKAPPNKGTKIYYTNIQTDPYLKQVLKFCCTKNHYLLPRQSFEYFSHTAPHSLWYKYAVPWGVYYTNSSSALLHFHYFHPIQWWRDDISVSWPKISENIKQVLNGQQEKKSLRAIIIHKMIAIAFLHINSYVPENSLENEVTLPVGIHFKKSLILFINTRFDEH